MRGELANLKLTHDVNINKRILKLESDISSGRITA